MDIRKVKKLIELLEESGLAEIEITQGDEAVRISRFAANVATPMHLLQCHLTRLPAVCTGRRSGQRR